MIERRRLYKNNREEYKKLQNIIRNEIKTAKQRWMKKKCEEMKNLISKHDLFNIHGKVKEVAGNSIKSDYL